MNNHESLIIRYIGQNTTKNESDVSLWELDRGFNMTWEQIMESFRKFKKQGLIEGSHTKTGSVNLTDEGWKVFHKEMKAPSEKRVCGLDFKVVNPTPKPTVTRTRKPTSLISFDGGEPVKFHTTKTNDFKVAKAITIYGELTETNLKWVNERFSDKLTFKPLDELN
jgi:hypothetical protein